MEHTKKYYWKRQTGKIFLLSKWIDVSSIGCTINYTNTSSLRELSLGVCFKLYWDSFHWESQSRQFQKPSLNSWKIRDSFKTNDSHKILNSFKTKVSIFDMVLMESLNLDSFITQVLTVEKLLTVIKLLTVKKPSLNSLNTLKS